MIHEDTPRLERHVSRMAPDRAARLKKWGKSLLNRINERELNQSEFASRVAQFTRKKSMGRDLISNYVRGISEPTPLYQIAMAKALSVTVDELMAPMGTQSPVLGAEPIEMHSSGSGRARLKVDIELPMSTAVEILRIINLTKTAN